MHKKFLSNVQNLRINDIKYDKSGIKTLDKILMEILEKIKN